MASVGVSYFWTQYCLPNSTNFLLKHLVHCRALCIFKSTLKFQIFCFLVSFSDILYQGYWSAFFYGGRLSLQSFFSRSCLYPTLDGKQKITTNSTPATISLCSVERETNVRVTRTDFFWLQSNRFMSK